MKLEDIKVAVALNRPISDHDRKKLYKHLNQKAKRNTTNLATYIKFQAQIRRNPEAESTMEKFDNMLNNSSSTKGELLLKLIESGMRNLGE